MSSYNARSSSYSSSRISSYLPSSTKYPDNKGYSTYSTLSYNYRPSTYSSTLSSKYCSPSTRTSSSTYSSSSLNRDLLSLHVSPRVPRFTSVSSYTSAITSSSDSKWRSSTDVTPERVWRSPSLSSSRRDSTSSLISLDRSPRPSLIPYSSSITEQPSSAYSSRRSSLIPPSTSVEDGPCIGVGLTNLGNTCFMNSVLQALVHTKPLVDYVQNDKFERELNPKSPTKGEFIEAFADFIKQVNKTKPKGTITPSTLHRSVQKYAPIFAGSKQQDSQEFLKFFLQGIHDDVNRIGKNDYILNDSVAWKKSSIKENSIIKDLFEGDFKNTLSCKTCNWSSYKTDPFWEISVSVSRDYLNKSYSSSSLGECLSDFTSAETLDGSNQVFCEKCKAKRRATKVMKIDRFPKILVIHIKRSSTRSYRKVDTMIDCPLRFRPDSDVTSDTCYGRIPSYNLYAVIDHEGTSYSGHYTAKCYNPENKTWSLYSDTRVSKTNSPVSSNSYLLFYIQEGVSFF